MRLETPRDKTALEIAGSEALFSQSGGGADEPWALGLSGAGGAWDASPNAWYSANATGGGAGHGNPRGGTKPGVRKAKGDAPNFAGADMHRMGAPQQVSQGLPHRSVKPTVNTGASPFFHHILDRTNSHNSSTNSLFMPGGNFGDLQPATSTGKRPRVSSNTSFLAPYSAVGFPSPPSAYDTDHPLPDFSTNWGFPNRNVTRSAASAVSAAASSSNVMTTASHSSSNLGAIGSGLSSPNGSNMFAVDSLLPDYDPGLYSLWNNAGSANVIGYEPENEASQNQQQPLYMNADEELKMDYPQLTEFNQGDLDYLCEPMESGGPSPTTPLGTAGSGAVKMDHLVPERRSVALPTTRELDRLLVPHPEFGLKRDRSVAEDVPRKKQRIYSEAFPTSSITSSAGTLATGTSSFRGLARSAPMETKRDTIPSLGSLHNSTGLTAPPVSSQPLAVTTEAPATTTITPTAAKKKATAKRPRSRQCDYPGCVNRARSHQKCKKHGGAHQCVFEGCTKNSQSRGLCIAHGGGSRCKKEGCVRAAQSKGLCKSHGGGEFCAVEGCRKKAHLKHLCRTHGGGVRCKFAKCSKWAQRKGWCMAHAKEFLGPS